MNQALQTLLENVHPLARACVKFVPSESPLPCAARNCWGTGEIYLMDFDISIELWDSLHDCAAACATGGEHCKKERLTYLRTGLCVACQRKPRSEKRMVDGLGRTNQDLLPRVGFAPQEARIVIPQAAYRNLIDFLQCDPSFCNHAIPTFLPLGWVSLTFQD